MLSKIGVKFQIIASIIFNNYDNDFILKVYLDVDCSDLDSGKDSEIVTSTPKPATSEAKTTGKYLYNNYFD